MDAKQIRENLKKQRSQKFRHKTQGTLDAETLRHSLYYSDPEWCKKQQDRDLGPDWQAQHNKQLDHINSDPKIVADRIKRNKENSIPIVAGPFGEYENANVLKKELGINFQDKLRLLPHLYYYKHKGPGPAKYENVYYANGNPGPNAKYHYEQALEQGLINERWTNLKFKPWIKWWNYQLKHNPNDFKIIKEPKREWIHVIGRPAR